MKRSLLGMLPLAGALLLFGCNNAETKPAGDTQSRANSTPAAVTADETPAAEEAVPELAENEVFVKLAVPNMTWGGCAASVRGDLAKIETVDDINTDIDKRTASFVVSKDVDYESKLVEFAKTNSHLAGYSIQ